MFTAQRSTDPNGDVEGIRGGTHPSRRACECHDEIARRAGRLDILVNNAGSMRQTDIGALSLEGWQDELALNLTAPFLLIQSALPLLKSGPGTIVNIGSIEGLGANPGHAAYCASKAGLHGLTCAVAVDLGKDGIRCNTVAPGWIDTELNEEFIESRDDPQTFRRRIGAHTFDRPDIDDRTRPASKQGQCRSDQQERRGEVQRQFALPVFKGQSADMRLSH